MTDSDSGGRTTGLHPATVDLAETADEGAAGRRRQIELLERRNREIEEELSKPTTRNETLAWASVVVTGVALYGSLVFALEGELNILVAAFIGLLLIGSFVWVRRVRPPVSREQLRMEKRENVTKLEGLYESSEDPVVRLVNLNLTNLRTYYEMVARHTDRSFHFALGTGVVGLVLLGVGLSFGFARADTATRSQMITAYISTGAGVITEFLAATFFYLYKKTVEQLRRYHARLLRVQNTLLAFSYVTFLHDANRKDEALGEVILRLVREAGAPSSEPDEEP